ncbi:SIS domain-containing protein [Alkalimonas delamerensis]|uniref:SIS domain-containing protein n=1 Tax=Alkalimonas delamerensis TaxID=265981 RepID=A0ABT9GQ82_9GAMM|nr:SIS domain-containing protein [Alkalimonas delamerensis]MDP4529133.1 SIS domain-containing protein [Alkalimonas delamerensis]
MQDKIRQLFSETIQTMIATSEVLAEPIEQAAFRIVSSLIEGGKVMCCGDGASAALAQHFAQLLLDQFETERPCLPALALQADHGALHAGAGQNSDYLARQVKALGQKGDILLVISLRGNEQSLIKAVEAALTCDMSVIALTVDGADELSGLLNAQDTELRVPAHRHARVYECYAFLLHCLCELIELNLFPQQGEL